MLTHTTIYLLLYTTYTSKSITHYSKSNNILYK